MQWGQRNSIQHKATQPQNLPSSIPPIDKDVHMGKLASYDASHNQEHSSVIRVVAFNVKLELNLDTSVKLDPRDPQYKDNIIAMQSKHKQAI